MLQQSDPLSLFPPPGALAYPPYGVASASGGSGSLKDSKLLATMSQLFKKLEYMSLPIPNRLRGLIMGTATFSSEGSNGKLTLS